MTKNNVQEILDKQIAIWRNEIVRLGDLIDIALGHKPRNNPLSPMSRDECEKAIRTLEEKIAEYDAFDESKWVRPDEENLSGPPCLHEAMDRANPESRFQPKSVYCPCRKCSSRS